MHGRAESGVVSLTYRIEHAKRTGCTHPNGCFGIVVTDFGENVLLECYEHHLDVKNGLEAHQRQDEANAKRRKKREALAREIQAAKGVGYGYRGAGCRYGDGQRQGGA